ncbi:hypothetical protein [Acinetobacter baumannii]|uniref:hypothetical protein n=1 Tax=Acinetobacter baumannii TaxID=470 RepID=UPI000D644FBE|nr:hypothetical protein [Acinetobacter baumannii]EHU2311181.1 hypothetical protein [Acinetobacter baumannii]
MSEFKECTACNGRGEVGNILDSDTCHYCKGSGVEREILGLPVPVGSLQELHPEFAKVLHENFLELISDDPHTENRIGRIDKPSNPRELETLYKPENHISPNCKVEDV